MVIVKLKGGLGNQLFQYALGRNLAHMNRVDLKLDISNYREDPTRQYVLKYFNIKEKIASPDEIKEFIKYDLSFFYKILNYSKPYKNKKFISQYKSPFSRIMYVEHNPGVLKSSGDVYLDGFWQSEKYFAGISGILRNEYRLLPGHCVINDIIREVRNGNSVALHIRRGDYAQVPKTNAVHGVLPLEYYKTAVNQLKDMIKTPEFYVFTDDINWVRGNFNIGIKYKNVNEENFPDYIEFDIMRSCKHFIVANSSFSWWGAWLGNFPGKTVIAPQKWFNDAQYNTSDLLPESWYKI